MRRKYFSQDRNICIHPLFVDKHEKDDLRTFKVNFTRKNFKSM